MYKCCVPTVKVNPTDEFLFELSTFKPLKEFGGPQKNMSIIYKL